MAESGFSGLSNSKERLDLRVIAALRKVGKARADKKLLARLAKVEDLKKRIAEAKRESQEQKDLRKQLGAIWWRVHDLRRAMDTTMGDKARDPAARRRRMSRPHRISEIRQERRRRRLQQSGVFARTYRGAEVVGRPPRGAV